MLLLLLSICEFVNNGCVALLWHNAKVLALSKVLTLMGYNQNFLVSSKSDEKQKSFDYSPIVVESTNTLELWQSKTTLP